MLVTNFKNVILFEILAGKKLKLRSPKREPQEQEITLFARPLFSTTSFPSRC